MAGYKDIFDVANKAAEPSHKRQQQLTRGEFYP